MVLMLYVKMKVTGKDIISEYRIHVYADHLSFKVSGLFISEEGNQAVPKELFGFTRAYTK